MNVASLELCKELCELSGWRDTFNSWEYSAGSPAGEPYLTQPDLLRRYGLWGTNEVIERFPAYDLGYLMRKLPPYTHIWFDRLHKNAGAKSGDWSGTTQTAETPEDGAALLAIELFKQGILTRDGA